MAEGQLTRGGRIALAALLGLVAVALVQGSTWLRGNGDGRPPRGEFVRSSAAGTARVWAVGDGADGSEAAQRLAARIRGGRPDRFLYLGDVYGSGFPLALLAADGSAADFRERYASVYGALAPRTAPTPGNHEWGRRAEGYEAYWRAVLRRPTPAYYAFSVGGWRLLSLNSEDDHGPRSAQVRWLRTEVRAPGRCRLAFWHRPRFSAGRHGDQPDVAPLWRALTGRAAIVLSGHDHNLQRFRPVAGLTQFVVGGGGHSRSDLRPDPRLAFGTDTTDGALRLDLRPGLARFAFVAADGRVLDRGRIRCRPSA